MSNEMRKLMEISSSVTEDKDELERLTVDFMTAFGRYMNEIRGLDPETADEMNELLKRIWELEAQAKERAKKGA